MEHFGYKYGATIVFFGNIVLIYLRRQYLNMKPYWAGGLSDIPKYFKQS